MVELSSFLGLVSTDPITTPAAPVSNSGRHPLLKCRSHQCRQTQTEIHCWTRGHTSHQRSSQAACQGSCLILSVPSHPQSHFSSSSRCPSPQFCWRLPAGPDATLLPELQVGQPPIEFLHSLGPHPWRLSPIFPFSSQCSSPQRLPDQQEVTLATRSPAPSSGRKPLLNHRPHRPKEQRSNRNQGIKHPCN